MKNLVLFEHFFPKAPENFIPDDNPENWMQIAPKDWIRECTRPVKNKLTEMSMGDPQIWNKFMHHIEECDRLIKTDPYLIKRNVKWNQIMRKSSRMANWPPQKILKWAENTHEILNHLILQLSQGYSGGISFY